MANELSALEAATVQAKRSDTSFEMRARVYTQILSEYPADIARAACRSWRSREKWWPTEAELRAEMRPHAARREAMLSAVRKAIRRHTRSLT